MATPLLRRLCNLVVLTIYGIEHVQISRICRFIDTHPRISKISGMCAFHAFAKVVSRVICKICAICDFDQIFIYYLLK